MAETFPEELTGPSQVPELLVGIIIPLIFASLIVAGRLYSRLLVKSQGWDDGFILLAWLFAIAVVTLVGVETEYGLGHKFPNIPVALRGTGIRISYATISCYQTCLVLTKLSILFFYLRILKLTTHRVLIVCTMACVVAYGLVFFLLTFFLCDPVDLVFEFDDIRPAGRPATACLAYYPIMTASAVLHTVTDVWLIGLVVPHVVRMHLPRRQKAALGFVLTMGIFVACASLTRMAVAHEFLNPKFAQWDSFSFAIWTTLESSLGLICASVPMLRPVVRQMMGRNPSSRPEVERNVPRTGRQPRQQPLPQTDDSITLWTNNPQDSEQFQLDQYKTSQDSRTPMGVSRDEDMSPGERHDYV